MYYGDKYIESQEKGFQDYVIPRLNQMQKRQSLCTNGNQNQERAFGIVASAEMG